MMNAVRTAVMNVVTSVVLERSDEYNKQVVRSSEEYRGTQCEYSDEQTMGR
jgi:hypothetical protein